MVLLARLEDRLLHYLIRPPLHIIAQGDQRGLLPMGLNLVMAFALVKPAAARRGPSEATSGGLFRLGRIRRRAVDLNLHNPVLNPQRIATNPDPRTVGPSPIGQAKTPRMPGTGHHPVLDI